MLQWRSCGVAFGIALAIVGVAGTKLSIRDALVPVAAAQEAPGQFFPSQGHCHIGSLPAPRRQLRAISLQQRSANVGTA